MERTIAFNPTTYRGGGGGFLTQTIRLLTITIKRLYLAPTNLVTLLFIYYTHFSRILTKFIHQGVAAAVFEMRRLKKIEHTIFCFA